MKKVQVSMVLNAFTFVLALLGTIFMITGFQFMTKDLLLSANRWESFKFFTVDSNILVGISSLLLLIQEGIHLKDKKEVPRFYYIFKFVSTAAVLLTFFVTLLFLAPFSEHSFFAFYQNSNLFFHLIIPILSVVSFLGFEREKIVFKDVFYSLIPMFCYSVYYVIMVFTHLKNGKATWEYDFYGFLRWGISSVVVVIPILLIVCFVIGFILYLLQRKRISR